MVLLKKKRREQAPALRYEIDFSAKVAEPMVFFCFCGRDLRTYDIASQAQQVGQIAYRKTLELVSLAICRNFCELLL